LEPVPKVYHSAIPQSWMAGFEDRMKDLGIEWDEQPARRARGVRLVRDGHPGRSGQRLVDTRAYGSQKYDALAAHASQGRTSSS